MAGASIDGIEKKYFFCQFLGGVRMQGVRWRTCIFFHFPIDEERVERGRVSKRRRCPKREQNKEGNIVQNTFQVTELSCQ